MRSRRTKLNSSDPPEIIATEHAGDACESEGDPNGLGQDGGGVALVAGLPVGPGLGHDRSSDTEPACEVLGTGAGGPHLRAGRVRSLPSLSLPGYACCP